MVQYITHVVRKMFDYCIYLQPPTMRSQDYKKAEWNKRDEVAPEKKIREAIKDGLPKTMQHKLLEKEGDYRLITEEEFNNDALTNLELIDERDRETAKRRTQDEIKCAQADLRETSEPSRGIKATKYRKPNNYYTSGRGTVCYCSLCKNAGMPERKYMFHMDDQCQNKDKMARRAMSGGMADQNKQLHKYRKETKALSKKLSKMTSKHKRLLKINKKKKSGSREICKLKKKIADCKSSSDYDSDDSDDDDSQCQIT